MKKVFIYCEGYTEEAFINEILTPYFMDWNILVAPIICTTKKTKHRSYKGGVSDYNKIKQELTILCHTHKDVHITTMFDYYGMPLNTPGITYQHSNIYKRIETIEEKINTDIGIKNFSFHFMIHEFEGILFSSPNSFRLIADDSVINEIQKIRYAAISPEHINNSAKTAPSKRIEKLIPNYAKVKNGTILSKDMGIYTIMNECKHFRHWIEKIKNIY